MAIIRRLPRPELLFLFVGVWLCLALEPNAAARLPSDRVVFPSEPQAKLESRLKETDREEAEVSQIRKPAAQGSNSTAPRNQSPPSSESKVISFGSEPESNSQRPWDQTDVPSSVMKKVVLTPRIALETTQKCPEGYISTAGQHCRKET